MHLRTIIARATDQLPEKDELHAGTLVSSLPAQFGKHSGHRATMSKSVQSAVKHEFKGSTSIRINCIGDDCTTCCLVYAPTLPKRDDRCQSNEEGQHRTPEMQSSNMTMGVGAERQACGQAVS